MPIFRLEIERIEQVCCFTLSCDGEDGFKKAKLPYPTQVINAYQHWRQAYLKGYSAEAVFTPPGEFRGRVEGSGSVFPQGGDTKFQIREAEAKLLHEFTRWLRNGELQDIRTNLRSATQNPKEIHRESEVDIFMLCRDELAYLPWETWKIDELIRPGLIRIARASCSGEPPITPFQFYRHQPRVLAIWGDETGLNFEKDQKAIHTILQPITEIHFLQKDPQQSSDDWKKTICKKIADEQGWDVLFFTGHSDETELTGGRLEIAPQATLSLKDLQPYLEEAKKRGLQFAIFNSCSGSKIAEFLIGTIGLHQVVVMREPIHNRVAQIFLAQFLQNLVADRNIHEALVEACSSLDPLQYPSAYLIPSLFRHPKAPLGRIKPKPSFPFQSLLPSRNQFLVLLGLFCLAWSLDVQHWLMERRMFVQAIYRQVTKQIPTPEPIVSLVQIDQDSLRKAGIADPVPMNRQYLAKVVNQLTASGARVVGIDYVLELPHGKPDSSLAQALKTATFQQKTQFILAIDRDDNRNVWKEVLPAIATPQWTFQGHILLPLPFYFPFEREASGVAKRPFSYLLAFAYRLQQLPQQATLTPVQNQTSLLEYTVQTLGQQEQDYRSLLPSRAQLHSVTSFAFGLGQTWLNPILDFSLPPDRIYNTLPTWKLLERSKATSEFARKVVILVPYYPEAGVTKEGEDNFSLSAATRYWFQQQESTRRRTTLTGGEIHAYAIHHLLQNWLVLPIPDIWVMIGAFVVGGVVILFIPHTNQSRKMTTQGLMGVLGLYGLIGLQVYAVGAIVLPWTLPSATLLVYTLPKLFRKP